MAQKVHFHDGGGGALCDKVQSRRFAYRVTKNPLEVTCQRCVTRLTKLLAELGRENDSDLKSGRSG